MARRARPRHFSMLRGFHLADLFTIANGFCGVAAVFQAMTYLATQRRHHLYVAALLVPLALVMDVLDGRIARWRHQASEMGRELDSLADVISFGVAPAAIALAAGLDHALDQLALMYFVGCGVSRLARYGGFIAASALAHYLVIAPPYGIFGGAAGKPVERAALVEIAKVAREVEAAKDVLEEKAKEIEKKLEEEAPVPPPPPYPDKSLKAPITSSRN